MADVFGNHKRTRGCFMAIKMNAAHGQGAVLPVSWRTGGAGQTYIVNFTSDSRFAGVTIENVNFGGGAVLEFDALGSPLTGGTVELSAGGLRYRLNVAPFTGQVTLAQVEPGAI